MAVLVKLIWLSFIFGIVTTARIPKRKGKTTKSAITTTTRMTADNNCKTTNCINTARTVLQKMNPSADPCVDFYEYACGRFIADTVFPVGRTGVGTIDSLKDENNLIIKDIIVNPYKGKQPMYIANMKRYYRSCILETKIEKLGLTPYKKVKHFVNDFPTLNPNWKERSFKLTDLIVRYAFVYTQPLFSFFVYNDLMDSNKQTIYLGEPHLALTPEYLMRPRNDPGIKAYQNYLAMTAIALGADKSIANLDAKNVVDLEIALNKIKVPRAEKSDFSKQYNLVELVKLDELYPDLAITRAIRAAFLTANISLPDNETVINRFPTYLGNVSLVIKNFTKRTVQNLFGFKYAMSKVGGLTKRMRKLELDFEKVYSGQTAETPRKELCEKMASSTFQMGIAKEFVKRKFQESSKDYIIRMIDDLQEEIRKMINESTWMEQATKEEAYKKLKTMKRKIGYPDANFKEEDIEKQYEKHIMLEDNYFANNIHQIRRTMNNSFLKLREPVDKTKWDMAPHGTNAYYDGTNNEIGFLAGILQPPFFSKTFQDSKNYGAIGVAMGHEIIHGIYATGSQYDADGNSKNWWQKSDRDNFENISQCILDQNSNFYFPEINMTLNGGNIQQESVAENVGLKASFRAYKEQVRKYGERERLPVLKLSQDQMFFLSFGQLWCEKMTPERMIIDVTSDDHPPGKYRVIGPLQNSEDFAKAYNCPRGSNMNPDKKCSIW